MELLRTRDPIIPLKAACEVLGIARSTARRHLSPPVQGPRPRRQQSHRKLAASEEQAILDELHSERFQDQPPRQVYAELLDEGKYLASPSTMYRVLRARAESVERRDQRAPKSHAVPLLVATAPNQVWTWDISKLATYVQGVFLNLYLVLDMFSRFPIAWMIAEHENSQLAKQLFAEAIMRYKLEPGSITVHNDRGAPMTAVGFIDLLASLGVQRSLSRPRVSNDNPFSEACFKTIKYQPDYPGRFGGAGHARRWFAEFFDWYAYRHRHSGLGLFTPADVFFGRVPVLAAQRQRALDAAYDAHPERFVRGRPSVRLPPAKVTINPIDPGAPLQTAAELLSGAASVPAIATPDQPLPILPGAHYGTNAICT
jgi:transposase InsO family protein